MCSTMRLLLSSCMLLILFQVTSAIPILEALDNRVYAKVHGQASLRCSVRNISDDPAAYEVDFRRLGQPDIISRNELLLGNKNHYSIGREIIGGPTKKVLYTLNITNVVIQDNGKFVCDIGADPHLQSAAISSVVMTLVVLDAPDIPKNIDPLNATACCADEGVSSDCMPLCDVKADRSHMTDILKQCGMHIPKFLGCWSDGRNHVPCCARFDVLPDCLPICRGAFPSDISKAMDCIPHIRNMVYCFGEGRDTLPTPPRNLSTLLVSPRVVLVSWKSPTVNWKGSQHERYQVYSLKLPLGGTKTPRNSATDTTITSTTGLSYELRVEPYSSYVIYVTALNDYGSSLPTLKTRINVPSIDAALEKQESVSLQNCCKGFGIGSRKQTCSKLCLSDVSFLNSSLPITCFHSLDIATRCLGGEHNHTECCLMKQVPDSCITYCAREKHPKFSVAHAHCLKYLPYIVSCYNQKRGEVLSGPLNFNLISVGVSWASFSWEPPPTKKNVSSKITKFLFKYGLTSDGINMDDGSVQTQVTPPSITQLALPSGSLIPGSTYLAYVFAATTDDISYPSPSIAFRTNSQNEVNFAPDGANWPAPQTLNLSACCAERHLEPICMEMCTYELDGVALLAKYPNLTSHCEHDIVSILECGADGRDHSQCCKLRGVPEKCSELCRMSPWSGPSITYEHEMCTIYQPSISLCMKEGVVDLPRYPHKFMVLTYTRRTVTLSWEPPRRGYRGLKYIIRWKNSRDRSDQWSEATVNNAHTYTVHNLEAGGRYAFRAYSVNEKGFESLPSKTIIVVPRNILADRRLEAESDATKIDNKQYNSMEDCCKSNNVGDDCMRVCRHSKLTSQFLDSPLMCPADWYKILQCSHDNRNHTRCCKYGGGWFWNRFPTKCLGLCDGSPVNSSIFAHCASYYSTVVTCVRQGWDKLPKPPVNFTVVNTTGYSVALSWAPAPGSLPGLSYTVAYRPYSVTDSHDTKSTNETVIVISGLESSMKYLFYVTASTGAGDSLKSVGIEAFTEYSFKPEVSVLTFPKESRVTHELSVVNIGDKITIRCNAISKPTATMQWTINNKTLTPDRTNQHTFSIVKAGGTDNGLYMCKAENKLATVSAQITLRVREEPKVTIDKREVVSMYGHALLTCIFTGFPDHVRWYHKTSDTEWKELSETWFVARAVEIIDRSKTRATLTLRSLDAKSLGDYKCAGVNELGIVEGTIKLKMNVKDAVKRAAHKPLSKQRCCQTAMGTDSNAHCSDACDPYGLVFETLKGSSACNINILTALKCAADGHDHRHCCVKRHVGSNCLDYCLGKKPTGLTNPQLFAFCLPHAYDIVTCMEEEHMDEIPPAAPQKFKAVYLPAEKRIDVSWEEPLRRRQRLDKYFIRMIVDDTPADKIVTFPVDATKKKLIYGYKKIHPQTRYTFFMWASSPYKSDPNKRLNSTATKKISVETQGITPEPPVNVSWRILPFDDSALITWVHPELKYLVQVYRLYWYETPINASATLDNRQMETIDKSQSADHLLLLKPFMKYTVWMTSRNSNGESTASNTITFNTTAISRVVTDEPAKPLREREVGLTVGLVIAIMLIILSVVVIVALLFYYYSRRRFGTGSLKEHPVHFENPGYNTSGEPTAKIGGEPEGIYPAAATGAVSSSGAASTSYSAGGSGRGGSGGAIMTEEANVPSLPAPPSKAAVSGMGGGRGGGGGGGGPVSGGHEAILDVTGSTTAHSLS